MPTNRPRVLVRVAALATALALAACVAKPQPAPLGEGESRIPDAAAPLRLALVAASRGSVDAAANDSALAGLQRARRRLAAEVQVLQPRTSADNQADLILLADQDFDEVFAVGAAMRGDLAAVARNYPKRRFAIVDATVDLVNVTSLRFREQDGAFLAGALAAMVSTHKRIAFLRGSDVARSQALEAGFIAGAREIDAHIAVASRDVGPAAGAAAGRALTNALLDAGADVVFVAPGDASRGALGAVRDRAHAFAIDVDTNGTIPPAKTLLTSIVRRVDLAVFKTALQARAQKLPSGPAEFGLKDGGVALADFPATRKLVGSTRLARLARLRSAIVAGTLVPPRTLAQLAAFRPTREN